MLVGLVLGVLWDGIFDGCGLMLQGTGMLGTSKYWNAWYYWVDTAFLLYYFY